MSEFGRRLKANKSGGTDHGHGNVMFALGGNVNGGKMYGKWPGLSNDQLDNNVDLAVTTDYRTVLSEIVVRRLRNSKLGYIFSGLKRIQAPFISSEAMIPQLIFLHEINIKMNISLFLLLISGTLNLVLGVKWNMDRQRMTGV